MTEHAAALTPSQTVGPFLTIGLMREIVTPYVVDPSDPRAITISGFLLDGAGEPVTDGMVEIWQANAAGRYAHPADGRDELALEEGFRGFGRSGTVDGGRFELVTLKPGPVPWPAGGMQAPHLVVGVFARGLLKRLATRMYFPDEVEANAADPFLSGLTETRRQTLIARADDGGLRFDIVLQGPGETTFVAV
jgi:protocatechuate 3,4-dioxygenase, alpha subunit